MNLRRFLPDRQLLLILVLFAALTIAVLVRGQPQSARPYDPDSAATDGLLALRLWLGELGYTVQQTQQRTLPNEDIDLFVVLPNELPFERHEAQALRQWVAAGHTLLLNSPAQEAELASAFGVAQGDFAPFNADIAPSQPLRADARSVPTDTLAAESARTLDLDAAPAAVPVLHIEPEASGDLGAPTAAVQAVGEGTVWVLSRQHGLTNAQLRNPAQAALVPAILRTVPNGGTVLIDSYRLLGEAESASAREVTSLRTWLTRTASGRASLLGFGLIFGFLLLQGWRLGPPLPAAEATHRRTADEFVDALAHLQQRTGQLDSVAAHHKQRLKRALGRRFHLSADLPDEAFVRGLRESNVNMSEEWMGEIEAVLRELEGAKDERSLVRAVARVDEVLGRTS